MTTRRLSHILGSALCASSLGAGAAVAQITFQPSTASFGAVMGGQQAAIQQDIHRNDWGRGSGPGHMPFRSGRPPPGAAAAQTRFRPDPSVTAHVQRQFVDFVRTQSGAAGADAMARAFASQDLLQSWARQARPDGMRLGDVADAMAEYWVTNWLIAHGRMDAPPGTVVAVRDQVRGVLARNPSFARLSEAQRQEMAEALIYNTLLQGEVFGDAMKRRDAALVSRAGDAAVGRFRNEMHVDLRSLALTDQGFVRGG